MNDIQDELTEAVLFLRQDKVFKQMLYSEFEAVLDGVVGMADCAGSEEMAVYLQVSPQLKPVGMVFFVIAFDERGDADPQWNLPLRTLLDQAGGAVFAEQAIGLVDSKHCPQEWARKNLWMVPAQRQPEILKELTSTLKINKLGILGAATNAGDTTDDTVQAASASYNASLQSIEKETKLRETAIEARFEAKSELLNLQHQEQLSSLSTELDTLRQQLAAERELSARRTAIAVDDAQGSLVTEMEQRLQMRDTEIDQRDRQLQTLRQHLSDLRKEYTTLLTVGGDQILTRMTDRGISFVAYHPGIDHLAIPPADISAYIDDPTAYAAQFCGVEKDAYEQWLLHYRLPVCHAKTDAGKQCGIPIEKVANPKSYVHGQSNHCLNHGGK